MSESQINDLTVSSDMIVNGYAYSRLGENVRSDNGFYIGKQVSVRQPKP